MDPMTSLESWPSSLCVNIESGIQMLFEDQASIADRFGNEKSRLFIKESQSAQTKLDVIEMLPEAKVRDIPVCSTDHLKLVLSNLRPAEPSMTIFCLWQADSHDHLLITAEAFQLLASYIPIFPPFVDTLRGFGYRSRASDEDSSGCMRWLSGPPEGRNIDITLDIFYPARHGRTHPRDPWSGMRHTGLYLRYDVRRKNSAYVLLQPPQPLRKSFPEALRKVQRDGREAAIAPLLLLSVASRDWRDYLNHLEHEIYKLENKSLLVKVVKSFPEDWEINFCDTQALQRLRRRLVKAEGALISTHKMLTVNLKEYVLDLEKNAVFKGKPLQEILLQLENLTSQMSTHRDAAVRLLQMCDGISKVAFEFLAHRSSEIMERLSASTHQESIRTYQVSENVKFLTLIGVLYLPAGLIATLFSSNLVRVSSQDEAAHFELSDQFWIYPTLTAGITAVTIVPILVWQYIGRLSQKRLVDPARYGDGEKV